MNLRMLGGLALVCAAPACISAPPAAEPSEASTARPREAQAQPQVREPATVLYARDGTPVLSSGPIPGRESSGQEPSSPLAARDLAGSGGRMYILELYQSVIEERDMLSLEVDALTDELERARQALIGADQRNAELEGRLQTAAEENRRLREENVELAGRLTTAQIRRLQAEKILLEQRLAEIEAGAIAGTQQP